MKPTTVHHWICVYRAFLASLQEERGHFFLSIPDWGPRLGPFDSREAAWQEYIGPAYWSLSC